MARAIRSPGSCRVLGRERIPFQAVAAHGALTYAGTEYGQRLESALPRPVPLASVQPSLPPRAASSWSVPQRLAAGRLASPHARVSRGRRTGRAGRAASSRRAAATPAERASRAPRATCPESAGRPRLVRPPALATGARGLQGDQSIAVRVPLHARIVADSVVGGMCGAGLLG